MNLLDKTIDRLKAFEPEEGYYGAFSGGKDSQAMYHVALANARKGSQMKIAVHDADQTQFPNLALMKISAWHKEQSVASRRRVKISCCSIASKIAFAVFVRFSGVANSPSSSKIELAINNSSTTGCKYFGTAAKSSVSIDMF